MPDFGFKIVPKQLFFDRKAVLSAVERGRRTALSKIGAYVRQRMKSMTGRRSRNASAPGKPPKRHAGQLHDLIYFAYDPATGGVDIGPVVFKRGEAPALNEFGGTATRRRWNPRTKRRDGEKYTAHYPARPFAGPSLKAEIEAGTIAKSWANCVKAN